MINGRVTSTGCGVALIMVALAAIRWDARSDMARDLKLEGQAARITNIERANDDAQEVDELRGDDLRRELCRRLSGANCVQ